MFVNLHNHTMYSLLDAISKPEDIIKKLKELNQTAFAITDHGHCYNTPIMYKLFLQAGIKFIYGVEAYICNDVNVKNKDEKYYHIVLLAYNEQGRQNINKLVTFGNLEGFYYKPRIDYQTLLQHKEGLIVLSACMAGEIQRAILDNNIVLAKEIALKYKNEFGDNYYLEIQSHSGEQQIINRIVVDIAKELNIPYVITCDSHYVNKEDQDLHSLFVQIGQEREVGEIYIDCYIQSEEEIYKINYPTLNKDEIKTAIENTVKIAEQCNVAIPLSSPIMPHVDVPKQFGSEIKYLKHLCREGWIKREINKKPNKEEYRKRLIYELDTIEKMGFEGYFLLVHSYMDKIKRKGIGRGSSGGSLVAYLIGIVDIDPIQWGLYFERFIDVGNLQLLEEGRITKKELKIPDIDSDIAKSERNEVLNKIVNEYGKDNVVSIGTFQYLWARSAIKDVGRVLGIPFEITNEITKYVEDKELTEETLSEIPETYKIQYPQLFEYANKLAGIPRSFSMHASGKIITIQPAVYYHSLNESDGIIVIEADMHSTEELGLIKVDLLGLRTLDVIFDVLEMIGKDYDYINPNKIDLNNQEVFEIFKKGNTDGIFQFESKGMKETLIKMQPTVLDDLIVANALYRPGSKKYIDNYIERKFGREEFSYLHPDLEPILKNTYGIIIFQEQLIEIGRLAGLRNPDLLRQATAKKKAELMEKVRPELFEGLKKRGWTDEQMEQLWNDMVDFANYSFNKAHAAAYALIAYITAFLKKYHPYEFTCALLNSYEGKADKIKEAITQAKNDNIKIAQFDYRNISGKCVIRNNELIIGTSYIKHCNEQIGERLYAIKDIEFKNFIDFLVYMDENLDINSKQMEILIRLNFFRKFGNNTKLLKLYQEFRSGKNKYNSNFKETTKQKRLQTLYEIEKQMEDEKMPVLEQIRYEQELLGVPHTIYQVPRGYAYIMNVDTRYTPKLKIYGLATGNTVDVKMDKREFDRLKIQVDDFIQIIEHKFKPKYIKTEKGFQTVDGEKELWVLKAKKIKL